MARHPNAGKLPTHDVLENIPRLISTYYTDKPDASDPGQRVGFGTSGHRGTSLNRSFNEDHILAIAQAVCLYRKAEGIDGPLFLGIDTHALAIPAYRTTLEVMAANEIDVMIAPDNGYTPTPAVSLAILNYNRGRKSGLSDGIIISPSHNPPRDGGLKYNPPSGGPADKDATDWIEKKANEFLETGLSGIKRIPLERALKASTTHEHDYLNEYVSELGTVLDMDAIRDAKIKLGVDPLGGSGVAYWGPIGERYKLDLTVLSEEVDETFRFMTLDTDGKIRMDPSSADAMQRLIGFKDQFEIAFACDTDHDRHGIVTKSHGLMAPNHYLSAAIYYLYQNRPEWSADAAIGKTVVSSSMIDRVARKLGRRLHETPVGFKWFVDGLVDGSLGFVGEESAGASFARRDGSVWTTDKDGIAASLLSAEITAKTGSDPAVLYGELTAEFGEPVYGRISAPANAEQKSLLKKLSPDQVKASELAGEKIEEIMTNAPGNGASIGGLKVSSENGWFAARPSGTEDIYKIYAESFKGQDHLEQIFDEAQSVVNAALGGA